MFKQISCVIVLAFASVVFADEVVPTDIEQRLDELERRVNTTSVAVCPCEPVCKSYCYADASYAPTQLNGFLRGWDGAGNAERLTIGYEGENGFGVRGSVWAFDDEGSGRSGGFYEVEADTVDLDFYKRFRFGKTDLVVGTAPREATLRVDTGPFHSRYSGGGIGMFTEWRHAMPFGDCNELSVVGKGRMALVVGNWESTSNILVRDGSGADDDTISMLSAALGLEYRRYFGCRRSWYLQVMPEIQRWDSARVTSWTENSIGFLGTNFGVGLAW